MRVKYIKVEVYEGIMSAFKVNYKSTYTLNDSLIFEQNDSISNAFVQTRLCLPNGTFWKICAGVSKQLDLLEIGRKFPTTEYDFGTVYVE
ncbi:MAG: hypothetical protein WKF87_19425 [Chryseolinea sp.]